jgi:hypothetical protein
MRHLIVHHATDGGPLYHETDDLDGAVRLVEHLRNVDSVTDARIFSLHEVPIEYRAYYRVEVTTAPMVTTTWPQVALDPEPEPIPVPVMVPEDEILPVEPVGEYTPDYTPPAPPPAASRFGLFSRG